MADKQACCNTLTLTIVRTASYLSLWIGVLIVIAGAYIYVSDWGVVDINFIQGPSILLILMGGTLFSIALIGLQGIRLLYTRFGVCSGHFLLAIYITFFFGCIAAEAWALSKLYETNERFRGIIDDLSAGKSVAVIMAEKYFSKNFNRLFFAASNTCSSFTTYSFWTFVRDHCPSSISKKECNRCFYYAASSCSADQNMCYQSIDEVGPECPFMICRLGFLEYFTDKMNIVVNTTMAIIIFQFVLACSVIFLIIENTYTIRRESESNRVNLVRRETAPPLLVHKRLSYNAQGRMPAPGD